MLPQSQLHHQFLTKKNNKFKLIIAISLAALLVVVGVTGGYFLMTKRKDIELYDYLDITAIGTNNYGEIILVPNESVEPNLEELIYMLDFEVLNGVDGELANQDEIEIFIDNNQEILKKQKLKLINEKHAYKVTGLSVIPENYQDIKDPGSLLSSAENSVDIVATAYKSALETSAQNQYNVSIPVTVDVELVETWYHGNTTSDSCTALYLKASCGTVGYVYKLHATAQSSEYYLTNPDIYLPVVYTGIHYDESEELQYDLYTDLSLGKERELSTIEEKLTDLGLTKI